MNLQPIADVLASKHFKAAGWVILLWLLFGRDTLIRWIEAIGAEGVQRMLGQ